MAKKKKPETSEKKQERVSLEHLTAKVGRMLGGVLKATAPGLGFCLVMFDYGDGGNMAYCSSAQREDMVETLGELREMLISDLAKDQKAP